VSIGARLVRVLLITTEIGRLPKLRCSSAHVEKDVKWAAGSTYVQNLTTSRSAYIVYLCGQRVASMEPVRTCTVHRTVKQLKRLGTRAHEHSRCIPSITLPSTSTPLSFQDTPCSLAHTMRGSPTGLPSLTPRLPSRPAHGVQRFNIQHHRENHWAANLKVVRKHWELLGAQIPVTQLALTTTAPASGGPPQRLTLLTKRELPPHLKKLDQWSVRKKQKVRDELGVTHRPGADSAEQLSDVLKALEKKHGVKTPFHDRMVSSVARLEKWSAGKQKEHARAE